jgi:peroxiredoxin
MTPRRSAQATPAVGLLLLFALAGWTLACQGAPPSVSTDALQEAVDEASLSSSASARAPTDTPPPAPSKGSARVDFSLESGLLRVERGPKAIRRSMSSEPPAGLDHSALPAGDWLFGELPLTKTESIPYAASADRTEVWFDGNRDGILSESELVKPRRSVARVNWFDLEGLVRQAEPGGSTAEVSMPLALGLRHAPSPLAFSRLNGYRRGVLKWGDREAEIVLIDRTQRGWFNHRGRDRLLVDVDGNGRFDLSDESHERFRLDRPFPFGDVDLVLKELAPLGAWATVELSAKPARRLPSLAVGEPAPAFQVTRLDGSPLASEELKGRWVLIDFWATWCVPCVRELPHLRKLQEAHPELQVVGISGDRQREALTRFVDQRGISWPQVFDDARPVISTYRVTTFPRSYLVDPEGLIAAKDLRGTLMEKRFNNAVAAREKRLGS